MPRTNGGIIGKRNVISFGKGTTHTLTSNGGVTATLPLVVGNIVINAYLLALFIYSLAESFSFCRI